MYIIESQVYFWRKVVFVWTKYLVNSTSMAVFKNNPKHLEVGFVVLRGSTDIH